MKIGMIVAMDKEYKQLRPLFPENKLILQKSGIATVNAAIQAVEMIRQYKPDCIISSGCAGGNGVARPSTTRPSMDKYKDFPPAIRLIPIC